MKTFQAKSFQVQDLARAALHDGCIFSWDTGCGKTIAAFLWPLLKVGWEKRAFDGDSCNSSLQPASTFELVPKRAVLLVVPGDLHAQFAAEAWLHFKIRLTPIDSQAAYERLTKPEHGVLQRRDAEGRPYVEPAFYITSYTQLASNGKETLTDPADHPNPRDLLAQWHLKTGAAQKCVTADQHGDWEEHQDAAGRLLPHVAADVCSFHAWRARVWPKPFQELGLRPTDSLDTMDDAYEREVAKLARVQDERMRDALQQNLDDAKRVLENLLGRREHATFHDLTTRQQDWIIREYLCVKH